MRILTVGNMYPPHHLGGYEITWRSSVEHLRGRGHDVTVLTTGFHRDDPDDAIPEDPDTHRSLRWYWHDHEWPALSLRERIALERHNHGVLGRLLAAERPDVVAWWAMGGMSLSLIQRVREAGIPAAGVVGDLWMVYGPRVDGWTRVVRRLGPAGRALAAAAGLPGRLDLSGTLWLFNSADTARRSVEESGFELDRTEIAHPGVDTAFFAQAPQRPWGDRLLYVGRLDDRKGVDTAIETLAHLPGTATLTVLGAGEDDYLRQLQAQVARLGVGDRVRFDVRPRAELPAAYAEADVLVFPVRWDEPWGLVPLEAMAVGTPVIATGTGGSGEYLRDGENALVLGRDAGASEFAEAARRLAGDAPLREDLRENGLATAARYSERAYNEQIERALERAAGRA
jgi:glycogen(starch) synthase